MEKKLVEVILLIKTYEVIHIHTHIQYFYLSLFIDRWEIKIVFTLMYYELICEIEILLKVNSQTDEVNHPL